MVVEGLHRGAEAFQLSAGQLGDDAATGHQRVAGVLLCLYAYPAEPGALPELTLMGGTLE